MCVGGGGGWREIKKEKKIQLFWGGGEVGLEQGKTSHHCLEYSQHGEAVSEWCGEGRWG